MAAALSSLPASPLTALPGASAALADLGAAKAKAIQGKARAAAMDFEAVYLNSMFSQMFTGTDGQGPVGGGGATGVWRSFLIDQYARSFAHAGGIGIADNVYRSLLAHQEAAQKS
jgi:peptidoglycan hydrolase FlgJ